MKHHSFDFLTFIGKKVSSLSGFDPTIPGFKSKTGDQHTQQPHAVDIR
jgi:hypothetical protein